MTRRRLLTRLMSFRTVPPWLFHPISWGLMAVIVIVADWWSGPYIQLTLALLVPIALAAWVGRLYSSLAMAVGLAVVRDLVAMWDGHPPLWSAEHLLDTFEQALLLSGWSLALYVLGERQRQLALHVRTLEGLLPICSFCKQIRDDQGEWVGLESYIEAHSKAEFTHGICPSCAQQHYGMTLPPRGR